MQSLLRAPGLLPVLLIAAMLPAPVRAQGHNAACTATVRAIYDRAIAGFGSGSICRTRYTMVNETMLHGRLVARRTAYETLADGHRMQTTGGEMDVYSDETTTVSVIPGRRELVIAEPGNPFASDRATLMTAIRDTIMAGATSVECVAVKNDPHGADHRATFQLGSRVRELLQLGTMAVLYNERRQTLARITLEFLPGSATRRVELTYESIEPNYRITAFDAPLLRTFFDANGHLLPRYAGYRIRDLRRR
ncbi:MAG: hypothetical protein JST22_07895 [Bacteroidetes bacterium]|nr:hypothetical protein [Bacteroidota bacterium]